MEMWEIYLYIFGNIIQNMIVSFEIKKNNNGNLMKFGEFA